MVQFVCMCVIRELNAVIESSEMKTTLGLSECRARETVIENDSQYKGKDGSECEVPRLHRCPAAILMPRSTPREGRWCLKHNVIVMFC